MIEVSYNHKSPFSAAWSTGSTRFKSHQEFGLWLVLTLKESGPVLITQIKVV